MEKYCQRYSTGGGTGKLNIDRFKDLVKEETSFFEVDDLTNMDALLEDIIGDDLFDDISI